MHRFISCQCNLTSGRAKKIHENALKGGAEADLVLYDASKASPLDQDQEGYTHVVLEQQEPQKVVVEWLGLKPHGQGGPLVVKPLWISACFTSKSHVAEDEFADFSDVKPPPAPAPSVSDEEGPPKGKKARMDGEEERDPREGKLHLLPTRWY